MKKALITGVTGQDGSYLAELLLQKGYEVHGIIRRASSFNTGRLEPIYRDPHESGVRFLMHYGDLSDSGSLVNLIRGLEPDEIYHLGAQSHVKVSFEIPEYTSDATGMGTVRMLEAIRASGVETRFYQAGSSEMFGAAPPPQSEDTPFYPRSPYGVAKVFAHWMTVNYREAHGLYACNGILFNHESVPSWTPVVIRKNGHINVLPIDEVVPHRRDPSKGKRYTTEGGDLEVWDGERWARCTARTATWKNEDLYEIHGRGAIVEATADHVVFTPDGEKPAGEFSAGDGVLLSKQPSPTCSSVMTVEEAWLLGVLVADGYVSSDGSARVTGNDPDLLQAVGDRWALVASGWSSKGQSSSGITGKDVATIELRGNAPYARMLRHEIYGPRSEKRVPKRVLNSSRDAQVAFLTGYNLGDGLWAGHGNDVFKSFRTNSPLLAAGLVWLSRIALGRRVSVYQQPNRSGVSAKDSYLINLSLGDVLSSKGSHLPKPQNEVRKVVAKPFEGWTFDLATETGRFAAGVGFVTVHNSPRRGETFVTRKVTRAVARIKAGLQEKVYLGNLDAKRDWGYAKEYVEVMWLMLQQDEPDDFVIATGETHSVREFCELAFSYAGLDWQKHVEIDPQYLRPSEVDFLLGDASKARSQLGWKPQTTFEDLGRLMVDSDIALLDDELSGRLVSENRDR